MSPLYFDLNCYFTNQDLNVLHYNVILQMFTLLRLSITKSKMQEIT